MYREEILKKIEKLQPAYLPDWIPNKKDPGWAVSEIFSNILSELNEEFDKVPKKLFITYLDKLGYAQNPPLAAKVPISFLLTPNYKGGIIIPKGTEVATKSKVNFETTEAMMATSSKLISLIDYDSSDDNVYITDHSDALIENEKIELFSKNIEQNYIYFGDDHLFNIHKREESNVGLEFTIPEIPNAQWQYYGKANEEGDPDWFPFVSHGNKLNKSNYYATVKKEIKGIDGVKSYWIRVEIPQNFTADSFTMNFKSRSNIDTLFHNNTPINSASPFYPFGHTPQVNDSFYIASSEAFSKKGFQINISGISNLKSDFLSWQYWNGKSWRHLKIKTDAFKIEGRGTIFYSFFICPRDITQKSLNGEKNYWIRIQLLDNKDYVDYQCDETKKVLKPDFTPPTIRSMNINVENRKVGVEPQHIYQYREMKYIEPPFISEVSREEEQSLYFGFDTPFESGLISLYIKALNSSSENRTLRWQYFGDDGWSDLNVKDGSSALSKSGLCQFIAPSNQKKMDKFGLSRFWLKATFDNFVNETKVIDAIYMNTIEARESKTIEKVLLGSSDGSGSQKFMINETPVFDLKLWVLESVLPEGNEGYKDRFGEGYWVCWDPIEQFVSNTSSQRVYTFNSSLGEIVFGDDRNGKIPPMGRDNITVSYRIGGGIRGNVSAKEIDTLVDSVAYIDSVINNIDASGGADSQSMDSLIEIAPKRMKHRYKAVSQEDYYYLVREASSDVAKVSVIPSKGRVALFIVPFSQQIKPIPSLELINMVQNYINDASPATVDITVGSPEYIALDLDIAVTLSDWKFATTMKSTIAHQLERFLHPLKGGAKEQGWEFGTLPLLADLYQLLSAIDGIKDIEFLEVTLPNGENYSVNEQQIPILGKHLLVCNGSHSIEINDGGA